MKPTFKRTVALTFACLLLSGCTEVLSFGVGFGAGYATHYFISQNQQQPSRSEAQDQLAQRTMAAMRQGGSASQYNSQSAYPMGQYPAPPPSQQGNPYAPRNPDYMSYQQQNPSAPLAPYMENRQQPMVHSPQPGNDQTQMPSHQNGMYNAQQQSHYAMPAQGQSPHPPYQNGGSQQYGQPSQQPYMPSAQQSGMNSAQQASQQPAMPQQPYTPHMGGYYAQQAIPSHQMR